MIPGLGKIPWRRETLPTSVFWAGELMDCIVHGVTKESDVTEWLSLHFTSETSNPVLKILRNIMLKKNRKLTCDTVYFCQQRGRPGFDPWVGKIPWRREKGLPTPGFWPGEFHGLYSPRGCKESDMTEQFSLLLSQYY